MNDVLARWNDLGPTEAAEEILPCCGSTTWASQMASHRPLFDETALLAASDEIWKKLKPSDWMEAFRSHPRIGESRPEIHDSAKASAWSGEEQKKVGSAAEEIRRALAEGNRAYEQRFHRIFIVCATGKSPAEILEILERRLRNDASTELLEAAGQQRQITQLRLKKWLAE
jgi:2-oxo-4-hydroxy-4-carboxy-5-ureidoimidazoline decarboxylase